MAGITKKHRLGGLYITNLFLIAQEAGKPRSGSQHGQVESPFPDCMLPLSCSLNVAESKKGKQARRVLLDSSKGTNPIQEASLS